MTTRSGWQHVSPIYIRVHRCLCILFHQSTLFSTINQSNYVTNLHYIPRINQSNCVTNLHFPELTNHTMSPIYIRVHKLLITQWHANSKQWLIYIYIYIYIRTISCDKTYIKYDRVSIKTTTNMAGKKSSKIRHQHIIVYNWLQLTICYVATRI
jgi:hypothetical protein